MAGIQKIGFIGIGNMGGHMARHLVGAGFNLTVMDARPEIVEAFVNDHDCTSEDDPKSLGASVERAVLFSGGGVNFDAGNVYLTYKQLL